MKKKYEESNIQAIAEAIREKTGTDSTYNTSEMASGIGEVFEAGKKAECEEWESRVHGTNRAFYIMYFSSTDWKGYEFKKTLKPLEFYTYSIGRMFYNYGGTEFPRNIDLSGATQNSLRTIDSNATAVQLFTWSTKVLVVPDYKLPPLSLYGSFNYLRSCHTIEKIRIDESCVPPTFLDCNCLENVTFEGTIAGGDLTFASSPLSPASFKNIIKHLKDYKGTDKDNVYTLTFNGFAWDVFANSGFNDDDYAWIESKYNVPKDEFISLGVGWRDIVLGLGWNLVFVS